MLCDRSKGLYVAEFILYEILEQEKKSVVTESRLVVAWKLGQLSGVRTDIDCK